MVEPCLSRHARKGGAGDPFIVESLQWESSCRVFPPSCLVILITFLLYCSAPSSPRGGTRSSTSGISSLDNRIFSEIVSFSFFFLLQRFLRKERNIIGARLNFFPSFSSSDRVQINSFHLFLRKVALWEVPVLCNNFKRGVVYFLHSSLGNRSSKLPK